MWSLLALDNVKLNIIALLKAFVAFCLNRAVMDEDIRTILHTNYPLLAPLTP